MTPELLPVRMQVQTDRCCSSAAGLQTPHRHWAPRTDSVAALDAEMVVAARLGLAPRMVVVVVVQLVPRCQVPSLQRPEEFLVSTSRPAGQPRVR